MTEHTQSAAVGAAAPASDFLLWREVDRLDRRIDDNRVRVDALDQHGSRGVDGLRTEVARLRQDIIDHEAMHQRAAEQVTTGRRWLIGIVCVLIIPLYPLLGYALTHISK